MPPAAEALDAIGEFVVDVGGGHHGLIAFGPGAVLDAIEDSPPAFAENSALRACVPADFGLRVAFCGLSWG